MWVFRTSVQAAFRNPDWVTCKDFKIVNYAMKKNKKKNIFSKYLRWLWGFRLKWPLRSPILRFFKKRNDEWDWKLEWKFWKSKNFKDLKVFKSLIFHGVFWSAIGNLPDYPWVWAEDPDSSSWNLKLKNSNPEKVRKNC